MKRPHAIRRLRLALACTCALGLAPTAWADAIQVAYAGTLTEVSGGLLSDFFGAAATPVVGGQFTGGFIFDLGTADANPGANVAFYQGGNSQFYVDFGLDGNGQQRRYEQNLNLPYNQGEVGNDISINGALVDLWTAYGQLDNSANYEYVETGMVLVSFLLSSLNSGQFPTGLDNPSTFTYAGGCDPGGVGAAAGLSCARDMEFHAKKNRNGDPNNIYGDADIYGFITEMVVQRVPHHTVPEPSPLALLLPGLLGAAAFGRSAGRNRRGPR